MWSLLSSITLRCRPESWETQQGWWCIELQVCENYSSRGAPGWYLQLWRKPGSRRLVQTLAHLWRGAWPDWRCPRHELEPERDSTLVLIVFIHLFKKFYPSVSLGFRLVFIFSFCLKVDLKNVVCVLTRPSLSTPASCPVAIRILSGWMARLTETKRAAHLSVASNSQ